MYDEYGCDFDWTPEPRKMITAVLPHPGHGRLVEKVMMMVSYVICFKDCFYTLSWYVRRRGLLPAGLRRDRDRGLRLRALNPAARSERSEYREMTFSGQVRPAHFLLLCVPHLCPLCLCGESFILCPPAAPLPAPPLPGSP